MNKKKLLILAAAALLFVLVVCCAVLFAGGDEPEAATEGTEATAAETTPASVDDPIFAQGSFTFTASQFRDWFAGTLPAGFLLADSVIANPARGEKLQLDILTITGESTGMAILFDVWEPEASFSKMALTAGADGDADDFAVLAEWYISTFMTGLSAGAQDTAHGTFTRMFNEKGTEYELVTADAHVSMMMPYAEDSGTYYYLMISIN